MTWSLLMVLACAGGGEEAPAPSPSDDGQTPTNAAAPTGGGPVLAVSAPLSGPHAAIGDAAIEGVRMAVPPGVQVLPIDEAASDPVAVAMQEDRIIGVVAHVTEDGAERWASGWRTTDLAVVSAAPATVSGLPRVLAGADRHALCATAFLGRGDVAVVHDGATESTHLTNAASNVLRRRGWEPRSIDPRQMAREADRLRDLHADVLLYTGDPATGGNLLRVYRQLGGTSRFLGVGLYDPRFATSAGSLGEGALVTSQDRPAIEPGVRERWVDTHGLEPPAVALNAYDAARLLVAAWESTADALPSERGDATRQALGEVEVIGAAGPMQLDADGVASPAWCTAFELQDGALAFHGAARVVDGRVETVDLSEARQERVEALAVEEEARRLAAEELAAAEQAAEAARAAAEAEQAAAEAEQAAAEAEQAEETQGSDATAPVEP